MIGAYTIVVVGWMVVIVGVVLRLPNVAIVGLGFQLGAVLVMAYKHWREQ